MQIPATFNDTDLVVISALRDATSTLNKIRDIFGVNSEMWHRSRAGVEALRAVLSEVGFDSDGIDHVIDNE